MEKSEHIYLLELTPYVHSDSVDYVHSNRCACRLSNVILSMDVHICIYGSIFREVCECECV